MRRLINRGLGVAITALSITLALGGLSTASAAPSEEPSDEGPSILIVGGSDATELLGAVSLQLNGRHFCTGNLITREWVLTAAHCSVVIQPGVTQVRTGSLDWTTGGQLVGVSQVYANPVYTGEVVKGDHALVHLDRRVRARPIPTALDPGRPGTLGRITGWGLICKDPARPECAVLPNRLQQLETAVVPPKSCDLGTTPSGLPIFDPKTEVCLASADGQTKMACNGDSGGPLLRKIRGHWFLVATTSGDGDDLEPRPNDCNTAPDGSPGVGMWEKVGPSFHWIVQTLLGADPAAAQEFSSTIQR